MKRLLLKQPWMGPFAALVALWVFFAVRAPGFASAANAATMARQTTVVAICSVGMTLVIVSGGIDLSVGSAVAFTTVVVAATLKAGFSPVLAVIAGMAAAALSGAASGALVAYVRMAPFIVTLGAMSILRGGAKGLAGEQKIDCDPRGIDSLLAPSSGVLLPAGVWIAVLLGVGGALALRYTRFGRHVYAVGSNEATALVCGVDVPRVKLLVYALAGALTGIAGIMEFSRLTVGDPTDSIGLELEVIAAVVVGGASLSGGEGTVVGSLVGAVLMAVIRTGCTFLGVHNWVQEIVTGGIIVMAVALDRFRHRAT
ncbi:MAG TPA: ABC transporter permease [Polyangiaceae bacterium]|nr:ABC transporter permease [Polyangiaceae bacterium]